MPKKFIIVKFMLSLWSEWRKEEMARIDELYSGPERKAALVGLLEQEAYLIASIDRHRLVADEENKDKRIKGFLNKVCLYRSHNDHSGNLWYKNRRALWCGQKEQDANAYHNVVKFNFIKL